jgi:predicted nucleotidyltransferase
VSLDRILAGLNAAEVRYVVIGGVAAIWHGSARITNDVDICYDPESRNRDRLARVLAAWNAYMRGVERGLPFTVDARQLLINPVLTLVSSEGDLDVMDRVPGIGDYPQVELASEPAALMGIPVRVISLDALIAAKRATGRRKDREALLELEALREMVRKRKGRDADG